MSIMREFLRRPRLTGAVAVAPSSATLAQAMTTGLDLEHADAVVELRSGTVRSPRRYGDGWHRGHGWSRSSSTPSSPMRLADRCRDSTVEVVHGSAENLPALVPHPVDAVVSGLPWTVMPHGGSAGSSTR